MGYYRKKPIVIEARQYTRNGLEAEAVADWSDGQQTDKGLMFIRWRVIYWQFMAGGL